MRLRLFLLTFLCGIGHGLPPLTEYNLVPTAVQLARQGASALPQIREHLGSGDTLAQRVALYAAGELGPEGRELIPSLVTFLGAADRHVRLNAVVALGRMGPFATAATGEILRRLDDDDGGVRNAAYDSIVRIGNVALPHVADLLTADSRSRYADPFRILSDLGAASLPVLFRYCASVGTVGDTRGYGLWHPLQQHRWIFKEAVERSGPATPHFSAQCRLSFLAGYSTPASDFHLRFLPKGFVEMKKYPPDPKQGYTPVEEIWSRAFLLGALGEEARFALPAIEEARSFSPEPRYQELLRWAQGRISRREPAGSAAGTKYLDWVVAEYRSGNSRPARSLVGLLNQLGPTAAVLAPLAPALEPLVSGEVSDRHRRCSPDLISGWARAIVAMGPGAYESYRRAIPPCLSSVRSAHAVYSLVGDFGDFGETALPTLKSFLPHPEWNVRLAALRGLERIASPAADSILTGYWQASPLPRPASDLRLETVLAKPLRKLGTSPAELLRGILWGLALFAALGIGAISLVVLLARKLRRRRN